MIKSGKKLSCLLLMILFLLCTAQASNAFTIIENFVKDGVDADPQEVRNIFNTVNQLKGKEKKKALKSLRSFKIIKPFQTDPKNIQIEIDNSSALVGTASDVQLPITNSGFLMSVQEAIDQWNNVETADINFLPLKLTTNMIDPEDGHNVITARVDTPFEGTPDSGSYTVVQNIAKTDKVVFMGIPRIVKPGTILDTDIIYDPSNNPCLAVFTSVGTLKVGGDTSDAVVENGEGGADVILAEKTCDFKISFADVTDIAMRATGRLLGLETSNNVCSTTSDTARIMVRYKIITDDEIGISNIYPNKAKLNNHGSVSGTVFLKDNNVRGAHVVIEDKDTGEPIASAITDINGSFDISAIPEGIYNVYAEPIDGPFRRNEFSNVFARNADLNFTTGLVKDVSVQKDKKAIVKIQVKETSGSAFNINPKVFDLFTEAEVEAKGGNPVSPLTIMPGQTINDVEFWGINLDNNFGTLTISGEGVTISNVRNTSVRISDEVECQPCEDPEPGEDGVPCLRDDSCPADEELVKQADEFPGLLVNITASPDASLGPRNIIFTADKFTEDNPNFGLRDQITGGLIVGE